MRTLYVEDWFSDTYCLLYPVLCHCSIYLVDHVDLRVVINAILVRTLH